MTTAAAACVASLTMNAAGAVNLIPDSDFEANPTLYGWTTTGSGTNWTTSEHYSGNHSILARTDTWSSPLLETNPLQWYRLSFHSKTTGTVNNPGSVGYGYWSVLFYDQSGNQLTVNQYSSIFQSSNWATNNFRIRAPAIAGPGATLLAARMKINFQPIGSQPLYIDDVELETTTTQEVAQWADSLYNSIPAQLNYTPKGDRWKHIPLTIKKLQSRQNVRMVMLGDSVQQNTASSPIDAFLERKYPGSHIELIPSTRNSTGVQYYKDHVQEYVTNYKPDLLVIGGISNVDDMSAFQSVINQVRDNDKATGHTTEILLLTKAWSPNSYPYPPYYFLAPNIRELDQNPANDPVIPDDYRGHLLQFANLNGLEYLEMTGISSEFIYGRAARAGLGSPDANGNPYSYWMRDSIHSNDYGNQIIGRELEAYFTPTPVLNGSKAISWGKPLGDMKAEKK